MLLGLAGKSCTGKNLIGKIMENKGALHIDLDKVNHIILEREKELLVQKFGNNILDEKGQLSRTGLSQIVFSDKIKLTLLEKIVHPLIDQEVRNIIKKEKECKYIVINGAVLHKSSLIPDFDAIIFSQSLFLIRFIRALKRDGFHPFRILERFWNQIDLVPQLFTSHVDIYKINNNRSCRVLEKKISALLHRLNEEGESDE